MHLTIHQQGNIPINNNTLDAIFNFARSHQFGEGIHLVKRRAVASKAAEHYGFAVVGDPVKYFSSPSSGSIVIHKTNIGIHPDPFDPFLWEKVKTLDGNVLAAVARAHHSYRDAYNLFFDNCEHFARFVVTGIKESTQIQNLAGLGLIGFGIWAMWRADN